MVEVTQESIYLVLGLNFIEVYGGTTEWGAETH